MKQGDRRPEMERYRSRNVFEVRHRNNAEPRSGLNTTPLRTQIKLQQNDQVKLGET